MSKTISNSNGMGKVSIANRDVSYEDRSIRKWTPIIESMGVCNKIAIKYLCLFAEYRSDQLNRQWTNELIDYKNSDYKNTLPDDLKNIVDKLVNSIGRTKLKEQDAYYNSIKNTIDYELVNGEFVTSQKLGSGNDNIAISPKDILINFPTDFQKFISPPLARLGKLNKTK